MTRRGGRTVPTLRPLAVISVLAPLLAAAACAGSTGPRAQEPPPLASLLRSPRPSPTATPAPTSTPTGGAAAVDAAVRAYVSAMNVAFATGRIGEVEKLTTVACTCRKDVHKIADLYRSKGRFVGARLDVVSVRVGTITGGTAAATLTFNSPASTVLDSKGKSKALPARTDVHLALRLVKAKGHWLVAASTEVKG